MKLEEIERYVTLLLTFSGVERKDMEVQVYEALHHLLTAMKLYDLMDADDRAFVSEFVRLRMNYFLNTKITIKTKPQERKRKKEKKTLPPDLLPKDKEKIEKRKKTTHTVCDADSGFDEELLKRYEVFAKKCEKYVGEYGREMIDNFVRYWTIPNQDTSKMHFEETTYWSLKPMLESWKNKSYTKRDAAAAMSLTKAQQKQRKEGDEERRSKELAAERERANAELERQHAESKAGAVSREEWLAMKAEREKTTDGTD